MVEAKLALVPLGGGVKPDGLSLASRQRLDTAIELLHSLPEENQALVLAIGGPQTIKLEDGSILSPNSAHLRAAYLREHGISEDQILLVDNGEQIPNRDTWFEAFQIRKTLAVAQVENVALVTHPEHEPRVGLIFGAILHAFTLDTVPVPHHGMVSEAEEEKRTAAAQALLDTLPQPPIPDPASWTEWCQTHPDYYQTKHQSRLNLGNTTQADVYSGVEVKGPST